MSGFQVGDKVVCIDNQDPEVDLVEGKIYTVRYTKKYVINLVECQNPNNEGCYGNTRFRLATPEEIAECSPRPTTCTAYVKHKFAVGDKVICVDAGACSKELTVGNVYTISGLGHYDGCLLKEVNSLTYRGAYRFRLATPAEIAEREPQPTPYPVFVSRLVKSGKTITYELSASDAHSLHMGIGISGEAGELLDAIKKATIYRKPLDVENVIEELGDLEFYMEGMRQGLGITREQCIEANMAKLAKRYGEVYSDQSAIARADKD